ncbi:MAG: hypothetical protein WCC63_03255, partial [Candidatus Bathyarchaeia archaeon]
LTKYEYVFQDMEMNQRYTIPYKSFKNESWLYEQEKYLKKVDDLMATEKAAEERKNPVAATLTSSGS